MIGTIGQGISTAKFLHNTDPARQLQLQQEADAKREAETKAKKEAEAKQSFDNLRSVGKGSLGAIEDLKKDEDYSGLVPDGPGDPDKVGYHRELTQEGEAVAANIRANMYGEALNNWNQLSSADRENPTYQTRYAEAQLAYEKAMVEKQKRMKAYLASIQGNNKMNKSTNLTEKGGKKNVKPNV